MNVSTKTASTIRHKIMHCLKDIVDSFKMEIIQFDEYYLLINLKETKKENMPRYSKKEHLMV